MSDSSSNYEKLGQDDLLTDIEYLADIEGVVYDHSDSQDAKQDERHRKIVSLTYILILIAIIQSFGIIFEPHEFRRVIANLFDAPEALSLVTSVRESKDQAWTNEIKNSTFYGRIKTSKVSARHKKGWIAAEAFDGSGKRNLIIGGFSKSICIPDKNLKIEIKIGGKVHSNVMTQPSKDKAFLFFVDQDMWIDKLRKYKKFSIRIADNCGALTDLVFNTKDKINLSFDSENSQVIHSRGCKSTPTSASRPTVGAVHPQERDRLRVRSSCPKQRDSLLHPRTQSRKIFRGKS